MQLLSMYARQPHSIQPGFSPLMAIPAEDTTALKLYNDQTKCIR